MTRSPTDWERVQRIGLNPKIKSLAQYESTVIKGLELARRYLITSQALVPSSEEIKLAHLTGFGAVHPWAGTFRKVDVTVGGMRCTPHHGVERELRRLHDTSKELFAVKDPQKRLLAIAFYHANYEEIHPFLDGNGRSGRVIVEAQLALSFKRSIALAPDRADYITALKIAQTEMNYRPLASVLGKELNVSRELSKGKDFDEIERKR